MENRSGKSVINLSGAQQYISFCPAKLPPSGGIAMDDELISLARRANCNLAILDAISGRIPDVKLFLAMYVRKEALLSSQIEGTQCTLDDVLDPMSNGNSNLDVGDVINNVKAIEYAFQRMENFPLCNRLIREVHSVLMQGVRGQDKNPGEFRTSQNWLGGAGSTIKNARYIPPNVEDMKTCMGDLEEFINADDGMDDLIKAALIHYQFETIHPFLDGNGRVGRLLIMLYLKEKKLLRYPVLYVSAFLKLNRAEYYDRMNLVRQKGDFEQWVKFFLEAIEETSIDAIETIDALTELHSVNIAKLENLEKRQAESVRKVFDYLESNPIIDITKTSKNLNLSYNTVVSAVNLLVVKGILVLSRKEGKNRIFAYEEYLKILRKDT